VGAALLGAGIAGAIAAAAAWLLGSGGAALPVLAALVALLAALLVRAGARERAPGTSGALRAIAGLLVIAMVGLSNWRASEYQRTARDETSAEVIAALEAFRARAGVYPDDLSELVPEFLPEVPRPQMGLIANSDEVFTYSNFGDSYALEFSSVLWVQCAYSPPYVGERAPEEEGLEGEEAPPDVAAGDDLGDEETSLGAAGAYGSDAGGDLAGSWSCDRNPPKLW
jgi:hypothetical protein